LPPQPRKNAHYISDQLEELHDRSIRVEEREIFLHSHYGAESDDPGTDYRMANTLVKNLRFLSSRSDDEIFIHQYNIGGVCDAGFAIYDAIKNCKCHITMICHGVCASMGTVILQAADYRIAMPSCIFLLHEGTTGVNSDMTFTQAKSFLAMEEYLNKLMLDIYLEKCKNADKFKTYTDYKLKKYITDKLKQHQDWIIASEEAKEYGFIDCIIGKDVKTISDIIK